MNHKNTPIEEYWTEENLPPFDELIFTWNAMHPTHGKFLFYVRVKVTEWSPWLLYATWGSEGQTAFMSAAKDSSVKVDQDTLTVMEGTKASAFQIKIETDGDLLLNSVYGLHVYTNGFKEQELQKPDASFTSINLSVPGLSQMALKHIRSTDLCSPTATTAVMRYLAKDHAIDPVLLAQNTWDSGFDIFGNWVFNVAEASTHLGRKWDCWVERLDGFAAIYQQLKLGTPVVVSVRGPLPGSAQPYAKGHLLTVIGYDSLNQSVLCMDPAFSTDEETCVSYKMVDFIQAWNRRGNIAYIFNEKKNALLL